MPADNSPFIPVVQLLIDGTDVTRTQEPLSISISEELGRLFEMTIRFLSEDDKSPDLDKMLGKDVTVALEAPDNLGAVRKRHWNGIVTGCGVDGGQGRKVAYHLVVRPKLWLLTRRANTRIHGKKVKLSDIIRTLTSQYGLQATVPATKVVLPFKVQYRETDFNFFSRLLEDAGLHYYFDHTASAHNLVIADGLASHRPVPGASSIQYRETVDGLVDAECIYDWRVSHELQPGKVRLKDWDYNRTIARMEKAEFPDSVSKNGGHKLEVLDHPGEHWPPQGWPDAAKLRMEEIQARSWRVRGAGNHRGITLGGRFSMLGFPMPSQGGEHVFVATQIDITPTEFSCRFAAHPVNVPYRPQRITPKPVVTGPQSAIVTTNEVPQSDEADGANVAHVKVKFPLWDTDNEESIAVRLASGWAGSGYGMVAVPRPNEEVLVEFIEGDPDRPIVTGRVHNGANKPPYTLPGNVSAMTIMSKFIGGGGYNELRFEDKSGSEHVHFHAGKDYYHFVKQDSFTLVNGNYVHIIDKDKKEHVKGEQEVLNDKSVKHKVSQHFNLLVTQDYAAEVTGKHSSKSTGDMISESAANLSLKAAVNIDAKAGANVNVAGDAVVNVKAGGNLVLEAGGMLSLKGGTIVLDGGTVMIKGGTVMINSGGSGLSATAASPKASKAAAAAGTPGTPADKLPPPS